MKLTKEQKEICQACPNYTPYHGTLRCDCHRGWLALQKAVETCSGSHEYWEIPCRRCSHSRYIIKAETGKKILHCEVLKITLNYNEEVGTCGHYKAYTPEDYLKEGEEDDET